MVTATNVFNRFKNNTVMSGSESFIQKYIRMKKRQEATPKCLFGEPSQAEIDQYLAENDNQRMNLNHQTLDKYETDEVPIHSLLDESAVLTSIEDVEEYTTTSASFSSNDSAINENVFQAKVISSNNPPPETNLFSPIDKVQSVSTEYWRSPKRQRSSSDLDTSTDSKIEGESSSKTTFVDISTHQHEHNQGID